MKKILHDYLYYTNNSWLIAAASCMKEETMELKDGTITLTLPPMGAATGYHVSVIHGPREETYHEL